MQTINDLTTDHDSKTASGGLELDPVIQAQAQAISEEISDAERAIIMIANRHPNLIDPLTAFSYIMECRQNKTSSLGHKLSTNVNIIEVLKILGEILNYPVVDLQSSSVTWTLDETVIESLNVSQLQDRVAIPVRAQNGDLFVACANPVANPDIVDMVAEAAGVEAKPAIGTRDQIEQKLVFLITPDLDGLDVVEDTQEDLQISAGPVSPVVEWTDNMLARAHADRVSDIHLSFRTNGGLRMRWRIDGELEEQPFPMRGRENEVIRALLGRCKTVDPNDVRKPQDGAFSFRVAAGRKVDARLSMMPQIHGPSLVMRILDPLNVQRSLDKMGFSTVTLEAMRRAIKSSQGMVFVVGPTGSGKSTTLYGMLYEMDTETRNVLTAEDPVEYRMSGIGQTEIRENLAADKSLTFARTLRGFMRMDPDVILVGEVRDSLTAEVALHAAMTGHLLLSTVHANSALGVFQRLDELDQEPAMIAESLSLAVSQRLLKKLHLCAIEAPPTKEDVKTLQRLGLEPPELVAYPKPDGCPGCRGTGYFGRIPVAEVLEPNQEVRTLVRKQASIHDMVQAAKEGGWVPIMEDAFTHVKAREVPVEQLLRCLDGVVS